MDYGLALGIDHGVNNWLTCLPNTGKRGFIIDGKQLKGFNQLYHSYVSKSKKGKPEGFWNNHLNRLTGKRNRQMHDATNKAAKFIVDYCVTEKIGNIVFGWNKGQSQRMEMGRKNKTLEYSRFASLSEFCNHPYRKTENSVVRKLNISYAVVVVVIYNLIRYKLPRVRFLIMMTFTYSVKNLKVGRLVARELKEDSTLLGLGFIFPQMPMGLAIS